MPEPIISVENLSKRYRIGHRQEQRGAYSYTTLRDVIARKMHNVARRAVDVARGREIIQGDEVEEFWALRDVSFEVHKGDVLGIIGRNGAGKSTLLKILSRITEPTAGRITLRGRIASLLEVGTGFHPELTGRENIYLNGAILGMGRPETRKKFDEIVTFAEVEKFLDTPVKRYSSGMYVRLAFAVAAHLEPEILIVDEVLAVGDAEFQKKCLGRMNDLSHREGRTVLFVSHNMSAMAELADRAVLLDKGSVVIDGQISEVISAYLSQRRTRPIYISPHSGHREPPHIARVEILTSRPGGMQDFGEPLDIKVWIGHMQPMTRGCLGIHLVNQLQVSATAVYAYPPDCTFGRTPGITLIRFHIPVLRVNVGQFHLRIYLTEPPKGKVYEIVDDVCSFEVVRHDFFSWWGPEICDYHEDFSAEVVTDKINVGDMKEIARHPSVSRDDGLTG
jgi:ABC-type polysaccharide/polyol phosphate transport system ATPase subunit